jgi:hypothetical protein
MDSSYEILEQIGHSFKLKLPESIKVHPVFYAKSYARTLKTHYLARLIRNTI